MPDDFELEKSDYIEHSRGVGETPDGQHFRWSNYASAEIPTKHPASIGGRRGSLGRGYFWVTIAVLAVLLLPMLVAILAYLAFGGQ